MAARVRDLAARQDGVVLAAQARQLGVGRNTVRRILRNGTWVALAYGCYWVAPHGEPRPRTRIRAALMSCGTEAVAVGPSAALVHGLEGWATGDGRLHVASPTPGRLRETVVPHRLGNRRTTRVRGLRVTTVAQTVADALLACDRMTAVSVLDSALHRRLLPGGVKETVGRLIAERTGAPRARRLMPQGDGRAESPLETRNRLLCTDAGMPPETLQWPLTDPDTGRRYRVDLGWPSRGVGVEADGAAVHGGPRAVYEDRDRQNALTAAYPGLVLLRFTWRDVRRPERFLAALRRALGR